MDWKAHYREELDRSDTREQLLASLRAEDAWGSKELVELLRGKAIISFPHTAIAFSSHLMAKLVAALYRSDVTRVVAIGVLHSSGIAPFELALDHERASSVRMQAFAQVCGGWMPQETRVHTPYGTLDLGTLEVLDGLRRDTDGLLEREFSLDTFLALLRLAADSFGRTPPEVLPIYVGMTRNPTTGDFEIARSLARSIAEIWDAHTAIVVTGDVVHYGSAYGSDVVRANDLTKHFRAQLEGLLGPALARGDWSLAYRLAQDTLRSDQRELLPVLGALLGGSMAQRILEFSLSDYAPIFQCPAPCVVASALIAYLEWGEGSEV